ncbi:MAG: ABC transporter permease [Deltaproteobacteria bacterium]|nr:ABC transporter permease [Deltaproteobacteria bacterium]
MISGATTSLLTGARRGQQDFAGPVLMELGYRPRSLRHSFDLIRVLVRRDFTLSYRRSVLGVVWSLLLPLAQLLVLALVFQMVVPLKIEAYPAFVFGGLLPWAWFSTCLSTACSAFTGNRDLVLRPHFSPPILLISNTLSHLITYLAAVPVLLGVLSWYGRPLTAAALLFPLLTLIQGALIVGLGLIAATLNVFYRDVQYLVSVGLMLLFYLTPVFYAPPAVPAYQLLYALNPIAVLVVGYRAILFDGVLPDGFPLLLTSLMCAAIGAAGWLVYRRCEHDLFDTI